MIKKRTISWLIIIICVYLIFTTLQAIVGLWRAQDKLTGREKELARLDAQQKELLKQKMVVESPEYLEKIARDKLGLSKPGEEVIIVPAELLAQAPKKASDLTENWKRWWRLLF